MFAFLSRLRLPSSNEQAQDDMDDASSLNRSLNLPWPVTESSARRPATSNPARRDWIPGQPGGMTISYPIPRSQPNSLTGFSDYNTASSGSTHSINGAQGHGRRAAPPQSVVNPNTWYEHEKPRRPNQRIQPHTPGAASIYAPPEVVRLDSGAFIPEDENENVEDSPPPRYAPQQDTSADVYPPQHSYPNLGYATATITQRPVQQPPTPISNRDETEDDSEFYSSPFDPEPEDARAVNTTGTSSLSSIPRVGGATMPKSKWGLKLQLHSAQSMPSLPTGTGDSHLSTTNRHPLSQDPSQRLTHPTHGAPPLDAGPYPAGASVDTDVYKHLYNYPLAKQLSPIPEQDYFSPAVESPPSRFGKNGHSNGSLRKASPGTESLGSLLGGGMDRGSDVVEKESSKMRNGSGRSGSVGSVTTVNGSEITRPSPIYASPFLTRHLNRTISQSSSKSDSQSQAAYPQTPGQAQPPTPTGAQGQTPVQSAPPMRPAGMTDVSTAVPRSATSVNSNPNAKEVVLTPTSAATTGTTGTMYTPTAASPITPSVLAGASPPSTIHPPTPAITLTGPYDSSLPTSANHNRGFPKIPSLPTISPLDWRSSTFGSVGPRGSREIRDRMSKADSTRKGLVGDVQKMPVIDGSVEGYYEEEEVENDEDDPDLEDDLEEEFDEDYERESLHAESFVTAGTIDEAGGGDKAKANTRAHRDDPERGVELATLNSRNPKDSSETSVHSRIPGSGPPSVSGSSKSSTARAAIGVPGAASAVETTAGDSFIDRRWERDAAISSSPTTFRAKVHATRWPVRFSKPRSSLSPAFWTFWLGFVFPVLWLVGGWHFTNAGELPPRFAIWEWYFWNSTWSFSACMQGISNRVFGCCLRNKSPGSGVKLKKTNNMRGSQDSAASTQTHQQRRKGKRRSNSQSNVRAGQVYPALPRWVAEKQSSDDGRMRLNDPKRSLRGISFGYPFIARPPASQDSATPMPPQTSTTFFGRVGRRIMRIIAAPNRILDLLYGVKLTEVRGRPESGRRMFDPWIQRCRYAMCYGLLLLAAGLCTASAYLIAVNTKKIV